MRVLVVEDDHFHASYLLETLAEAMPEVTETLHATDGEQGCAEARFDKVEAIVMDLQMAGKNGIDAARTIWACLLYTSPSPRDLSTSRMPSSA